MSRIEMLALHETPEPAEVKSFEVAVTDGFLDIDFLAIADEPALAALEIQPLHD